jgi:hypothetical protein
VHKSRQAGVRRYGISSAFGCHAPGTKHSKKQCSVCAVSACALCAALFLYVAQVDKRKLVCPQLLVPLKKSSAYSGVPKRPRIWGFSPRAFEWRFVFS